MIDRKETQGKKNGQNCGVQKYFHELMKRTWYISDYILMTDSKWVAYGVLHMSGVMRKPDFCICEIKGADQLCGDCTADQRLCFRDIKKYRSFTS